MVTVLPQAGRQAIDAAIAEAERRTSAELVVVVAPASDAYQGYVLLYGMLAGSAAALALWASGIVWDFPLLLAAQLTAMSLVAFLPPLQKACLRLIPPGVARQRAARRAYEEYMDVSGCVPAFVPIVLLYVSLAERYAHIVPSRLAREKIADDKWDEVIAGMTASVRSAGVAKACIAAVEASAALLAPHFPESPGHPAIEAGVIEREG